MTELTKTIRRRTRDTFAQYEKRIVVSLERGDLLAVRLERTRTTHRATLDDVFHQLAHWPAEAELARKRTERKLRTFTR